MTRARLIFPLLLLIFIAPHLAVAQELRVPPALQGWLDWVKDRHPDLNCAPLGGERPCAWPGRLRLSLSAQQGTFQFSLLVEQKGEVPLPGGENNWPTQVVAHGSSGDQPVRVIDRGGAPMVYLSAGEYELRGNFSWKELPETLQVPIPSGLVELELDGKVVNQPKIGSNGELWLRRMIQTDETVKDTLSLTVARRLQDGIPFLVDTHITLRIGGRSREIHLGDPLLPGTEPVEIATPLAYRLDGDRQLVVQGKPGEYEILIQSVLAAPPATLSRAPAPVPDWPTQENWAWQPDEQLRSVTLSGATPTDAERAELPDNWRSLSTYIVDPETTLAFEEVRRGENTTAPNQLNLSRQIWLNLDGNGATVRDTFSGRMAQGWRLNTLPGMSLGHVSIAGRDALITTDSETGATGVEIRNQQLSLSAESKLIETSSFPAVGWDHDVNSLSLRLFLPPGWSLFEAEGVDNLSSSWLSSWTLLDVFIVLLIAAATSRLLGRIWGGVALAALVLGHHVPHAPLLVWIHLLVCVALIRAVPPESEFRRWVYAYYAATVGLLLLNVIPFAIAQMRSGVFPQLGDSFIGYGGFDVLYGVLGGGLATIVLISVSIAALGYLFKAQWKKLFVSLGLIAGVVVLIAMSSALLAPPVFFNYDDVQNFEPTRSEIAPLPPASAPQQAAEQGNYDAEMLESYGASGSGMLSAPRQKSAAYQAAKQSLVAVDPHAVIQTGPGVPTWSWKSWSLSWSGPVQRDQQITLHLLSPRLNLLIALGRVLLFAFLTYGFIVRRLSRGGLIAGVLLFGAVALPSSAHAQDFPSTELLQELEQRVLAEQCQGSCLAANTVRIEVAGEELILAAELTSRGAQGWALPGPLQQFQPTSIKLDGKDTVGLRQDGSGTLWVRIPDGAHTVTVRGPIGKRNVITLSFLSQPGSVLVNAAGWLIDGLSPTNRIQSSIQLSRIAKEEVVASDGAQPDVVLPHWFGVRREFRIGLPWSVVTTVTRFGSTERPAIAKVPLAPGESVTSDDVTVQSGVVTATFPREVSSISWTGTLAEEPQLTLKASTGNSLSESWTIACSAMWRCSTSGIVPTASIENGEFVSTWRPWPNDELTLSVKKPVGVDGPSATVDSATVTYRPGARILEGVLELSSRSSRGGFIKLTLPETAEVTSTTVDSQTSNLRPQGRELLLPVEGGQRRFGVTWQQSYADAWLSAMPSVAIEGGAFNITSIVQLPEKRWILFAFGPSWGPAVLFWSKLFIVIVVSMVLGRMGFAPLRSYEWLLLLLGLATLPPAAIALPVLWFAALHFRQKRSLARRWQFNGAQLLIVVLSVASFAVLYQAVQQGLVFYPDMQVQGNGSSNTMLRWYVDAVRADIPQVSVLTAPLWLWRALMLLWSFWMVRSLLRWVGWGWSAFRQDGFWRSKDEAKTAQG